MINYYLGILIVVFIYFLIIFIVAQKIKNNSIVDIGWGFGFCLISLYNILYITINNIDNTISIVVSILIIIWGLRLFLYLGIRNIHKPEDFRYLAMRKKWGNHPTINAFFKVFMFQGLFMLLIASSIYISFLNTNSINYICLVIGVIIYIIGLFFESVGDWQLRSFIKKKENKGHIIKSGLWKITRHPNYFGEVMIWWGIWIIIVFTNYGYLAIISPLTITFLLLFVSGIPMLEKKYKDNEEFLAYAKKTSSFFPWFPKK